MMRKRLAGVLAGMILFAAVLSGCATAIGASQEEPETSATSTPLAGGWSIPEEQESFLTEDQTAVFDRAMEGFVGVKYIPVAVLATQVVAGKNMAYLCQGTPVYPGAGPGWYLVSIYADLEGGAQISAIAELDLLNLDTTGTPGNPEGFVGAWECAVPDIPSAALPEEVYRAFSKAVETGTPQAEYMPVVLLAEQVVAGMNYKILCRAAGDGRQYITVLTVYADLEGGAEITSEEALDLTAYTTPEPEG